LQPIFHRTVNFSMVRPLENVIAMNVVNPTLLVVGCGDLGAAVALHFAQIGWRVFGVRRNHIELPGVTMLAADVTRLDSLAVLQTIQPDYVLIVLTPGEFSDQRYRAVYVDGANNVLSALDKTHLQRVFWVSSTSVYHQNEGEWIDETSPAFPAQFSGARLLEAEQVIAASGLPHTLIRFGGIYGAGRNRLRQQLRSGQRSAVEPPRYSNRIHRDDAVAILQFLLDCAARAIPLQSLYLGVDTESALMSDIERWFCEHLGIDYDALAPNAPAARGGSRRCSSARLQALGYRFIYPTFRQGLSASDKDRLQD
jgi:nucleoside-diphosphate-sugar epimerase